MTSNSSSIDKIAEDISGITDNPTQYFSISSSSSDSALLSASISEVDNSDEEFEFPPVPLSIPPSTPVNDETDKQPPFELNDTPKEWDEESGFVNDCDEDFPLPPPPECLSPVIVTSPSGKTKNHSNSDIQNTRLTPAQTALEGTEDSIDNKPTEIKLSPYIHLLSSGMKNPFAKNNSNHEFTKQIDEINSTRPNQNSFGKLFKQLKQETDKDTCNKSLETMEGHLQEPSKSPRKYFNIPPTVELDIPEEIGLVDTVPPPMFANKEGELPSETKSLDHDAFSLAKGQLTKDRFANNIINEYYNDDGGSIQTNFEVNEVKVKPKSPILANALLPKHLKGEGDVIKILNPNFKGKSFDSTITELKSIISNCDPTSNLTSQKPIEQEHSKLFEFPNVDKQDSSCDKELTHETTKCPGNERGRDKIISVNNAEVPQKTKLRTAPKPYKLVKSPKVVGFTEEQIQNMTLKNSINCDQSPKLDTDVNYSKGNETSTEPPKTAPICSQEKLFNNIVSPEFSSLVNNSKKDTGNKHLDIINNAFDNKDSGNTEIKNSIEDANGPKIDQSNDIEQKCMKPKETDAVENLIKSAPICNGTQAKSFSVKGPNVVGFTEEQIKSMTQEKMSGKEECLTPDVAIINELKKDNENIRVTNTVVEKLQETKKFSNNKNDEQINRGTNVKRFESFGSLPKKPLRFVSNAGDSKSSFTSEQMAENDQMVMASETNSTKIDKISEQESEIVAVSKAKTFFKNISPIENKEKPGSFLKKASTFSVNNKTANGSNIQRLREKYQHSNNSNVIPEINQLTKMNSVEESAAAIINDTNEIIDDAPQETVENLVNKFGTLKKSPSKKGSVLENCMPPKSGAKLPGKSLPSDEVETKKLITGEISSKQAWNSFLKTYSEK